MNNETTRLLTMLALTGSIALIGPLATIGEAGAATACTPEFLPTVIVGEPASTGYTQPICARCAVVSKRETSTAGDTHGVLELTYEDEVYPDFEGDIVITVLLPDDTQDSTIIPGVSLVDGEQASWSIEDLPYDQAELVWLELKPAT